VPHTAGAGDAVNGPQDRSGPQDRPPTAPDPGAVHSHSRSAPVSSRGAAPR
jgi:hypothetical protein